MFQFPGFALTFYFIQKPIPQCGGLPHSDIYGSLEILHLPVTFRSLSRPSSPLSAKASTRCPFHNYTLKKSGSNKTKYALKHKLLNCFLISFFNAVFIYFFLTTDWWRWPESNWWPSACKADALPNELHPQKMVGPTGFEPVTPRL